MAVVDALLELFNFLSGLFMASVILLIPLIIFFGWGVVVAFIFVLIPLGVILGIGMGAEGLEGAIFLAAVIAGLLGLMWEENGI